MSNEQVSTEFKVGDFAIPKAGHQIFCGSGLYDRAVVVSLEPFVIISEWGDMMWNHEQAKDFHSAGPADEESKAAAFARIARNNQGVLSL